MKKKLEWRKIITSVIFGLLGFFLARFLIYFKYESTIISFHWSFIFPLSIAIAYGWKVSIIASIIGLGALYPLFLYPLNGWANLEPVFILRVWFSSIANFNSLYE